ncbi:TorF family putative porin [Erythrobacter sp. sf7]|uniref:TorF family putative porin n=1 Tax=Erythrobacter fulvus TaxID=2987523 RepID=A0ABT5JNK4_9SPHN|nr:TorF family putative porin [Erythrobacter fulvus]MDC8754351.1 TorF family putative porin [Erythrobacter fulvus]
MSYTFRGLSAVSVVICLAGAAPAFAADEQSADDSFTVVEAAPVSAPSTSTFALAASERAIAPIAPDASRADDEPASAITVSGSATLTSDYRFRGVSQTDEGLAVQGGITISHESGFYVGAWGSNLAGWGTFGGTNTELDLIAGFAFPVGEGTLDTGVVWYMYPSGADTTDFAELYAKLSGDIGPLSLTAGVAYAPNQEALGKVFLTGAAAAAGLPDDPGDKEDNLYLSGDVVYGIADTPISLKAHLGYSDGNAGLGPNGTSIAPTGTYFDWSLGADVSPIEGLTLSVAYIDTDISAAESAYLLPNFSKLAGGQIADATVVFSVTASF